MVFGVSFWWILPILLISVGVARHKYKKLVRLPDIGPGIVWLISSLRFLVVFILLFLLLKPALLLLRTEKEKPLLLIAQDNSASLLNGKDSSYYRQEYEESLRKQVDILKDKFEVEWLTFGKNTYKSDKIDFFEHYTDIAGVFDYIADNYIYKQPEAILLLSDGIYNTGVNPRYRVNPCPVYTVCLGDTTEFPDIYIKNPECDKFNYIKTIFPIKADIVAVKQQGKKVRCVLRENGNIIDSQEIDINSEHFLKEVVFHTEARRKGMTTYTLTVESDNAERSKENNTVTLHVNILDNSGDIPVFYSAPHPDVAAIVEALGISGIYDCSLHSLSEPLSELKGNVIILHNPEPENPNYQELVRQADKKNISLWYILTNRRSIDNLARFGKAYSVVFNTEMNEYATPAFNKDFPFFDFSEEEVNGFMAYPPLVIPFGEIRNNGGKPLFTQRIKNMDTSNGLLTVYDNRNSRIACFWGEGLWRWRLFSYKENGSHDLFNTLVNKIVNYLAAKKSNERFIHDIKPLYDETEEAVINVQLYNESYEPVNTPEVNLALKYQDKEYNYSLNRNGDRYRINLGNLSSGEYDFTLSTDLKGEKFVQKGVFYVRTQNPELNDMVADKALLKAIAENSGAEVSDLKDVGKLLQKIDENSNFQPVYKTMTQYVELGELKFLGIILLILLCLEWFLLKYFAD